ncbi:MAG TPA: nuclear transport factor 2 family protein [Acidimicrobiales bacterium]
MMLSDETAAELRRHWEDGWNGRDADVIMAPFADGIVFSSPAIPKFTGDEAQATVVGTTALRDYVDEALRRSGDVRYSVDDVYIGAETVVLVYTCHFPDGTTRPGSDLMRVDGDGRVVEWRCHYATDPTVWRPS